VDAAKVSGSLIGIQYENWFTPHNATWDTAEAVPILGKYSSYDPNILKTHFDWFKAMGIDWLLIDWSNMLWSKPAWESHAGGTRELEETVAVMFKTAAALEKEGKYTPKMVFMIGLQNGPPVPDGMKRRMSRDFKVGISADFLDQEKLSGQTGIQEPLALLRGQTAARDSLLSGRSLCAAQAGSH
jgi:hypothetical protein